MCSFRLAETSCNLLDSPCWWIALRHTNIVDTIAGRHVKCLQPAAGEILYPSSLHQIHIRHHCVPASHCGATHMAPISNTSKCLYMCFLVNFFSCIVLGWESRLWIILDKRYPLCSNPSLDFTALITGICYLPYISCLKALIGRLKWSVNLSTKIAQVVSIIWALGLY